MDLSKLMSGYSSRQGESGEPSSALIAEISNYLLSEDLGLATALITKVDQMVEFCFDSDCNKSEIVPVLIDIIEELRSKPCGNNILDRSSWNEEHVLPTTRMIPHMLYEDSYRYYKWLGKSYSGVGSIVELGCWMGAATCCIAEGLRENHHQIVKKIQVFDSFVWKKNFLSFGNLISGKMLRLKDGDSFLRIFREHTRRFSDLVDVQQCCLYVGGSIDRNLPEFRWSGEQIEIMVMDFCPDERENRVVWEYLEPFFIPNKTVLVYNQFGNLYASELRGFLREKAEFLSPIHKPFGSIKAFKYIR